MPDKDEKLVAAALKNLRGSFTPAQLYWFSLRVRERQEAGFGELRLGWWNGHVDQLTFSGIDKMARVLPPAGDPGCSSLPPAGLLR